MVKGEDKRTVDGRKYRGEDSGWGERERQVWRKVLEGDLMCGRDYEEQTRRIKGNGAKDMVRTR